MIIGDLRDNTKRWQLYDQRGNPMTSQTLLSLKRDDVLQCRNTLESAEIVFNRTYSVILPTISPTVMALHVCGQEESFFLDDSESVREFIKLQRTTTNYLLNIG